MVGPSKAISTIFYGQWWAHTRPSAVILFAYCGPIHGFHSTALGIVVGPCMTIGSHYICPPWAHTNVSCTYLGEYMGPCYYLALQLPICHMGPFKTFTEHMHFVPTMGPRGFYRQLWCFSRWFIPTTMIPLTTWARLQCRWHLKPPRSHSPHNHPDLANQEPCHRLSSRTHRTLCYLPC